MGSVLYLVLVLGCADDMSGCQTIDEVEGEWPSAEACDAAIAEILDVRTAADYPTIAGRCVPVDPALIAGEPAAIAPAS